MVLTGLTVDSNALNTANGSLKKRESVWEDPLKFYLQLTSG